MPRSGRISSRSAHLAHKLHTTTPVGSQQGEVRRKPSSSGMATQSCRDATVAIRDVLEEVAREAPGRWLVSECFASTCAGSRLGIRSLTGPASISAQSRGDRPALAAARPKHARRGCKTRDRICETLTPSKALSNQENTNSVSGAAHYGKGMGHESEPRTCGKDHLLRICVHVCHGCQRSLVPGGRCHAR